MTDNKHANLPIAVYVHLGPNLPEHLKFNLNRHQRLFPEQELVLITSHDQDFQLADGIYQFRVNCDELKLELFSAMGQRLDFNFRNGFWKYTLQRFFAIGEFHKLKPNRAVTHIESDVLVMPNFPWNKLNELRKLAWLKVNSELDVAAIVHFPSFDITKRLLSEIEICALQNPGTNDMLALHESARKLNNFHQYLPSITKENTNQDAQFGHSEKKSLEYFGGIFDPLNLGLWYFGQDPKNSFGLRMRYEGDPSHDLRPGQTNLNFVNNSLVDGNGTLIFSLHVHSKFLPLFGHNWEAALQKGLDQAQLRSRKYSFHLSALLLAFRGNKARKNLWQLLALIPGLNALRKYRLVENSKNSLKSLLRI